MTRRSSTPTRTSGHAGAVAPAGRVDATPREPTVPTAPLVHYEHPDRPGTSLCGAPVLGVRTKGQLGCVVCYDLLHG